MFVLQIIDDIRYVVALRVMISFVPLHDCLSAHSAVATASLSKLLEMPLELPTVPSVQDEMCLHGMRHGYPDALKDKPEFGGPIRRLRYDPTGYAQSMSGLRALALCCSLKPSPAPSSTELLATQVLDELAGHGVVGAKLRVVDYDVRPGVEVDMGDGDQWPSIRTAVYDADIVVLATPTWLGHMSSVAQRVLERLDAELSETDSANRPAMVGKIAVTAVVGNEDGAHKITADLFQGLNDIGFTIPAQGGTYWNGEAMQGVDYNDLDNTPEAVASTTAAVARNAAHLAAQLKTQNYQSY